ncbi:unnamed protein product [Rotaria sp. Silwood1]|nr:unnamed protein product [Rotaria sp. Silwood1]
MDEFNIFTSSPSSTRETDLFDFENTNEITNIQKDNSSWVIDNVPESSEFAAPGTCKKLDCRGRPCAKCYKCRDWHFTGDQGTWNWLCNWENWGPADQNRWYAGAYQCLTKRDGATCLCDPRQRDETPLLR